MSQKNRRSVGQPPPGTAKGESLNTAPFRADAAEGEEEEPLSHLRKRVFQPIQARIYSRLNRTVDRLGYFSAAFLLLTVTAASVLGITFWNSPEKVTKAIALVRFYFAARSPTPTRFFGAQETIRELNSQLAEGASASNRER